MVSAGLSCLLEQVPVVYLIIYLYNDYIPLDGAVQAKELLESLQTNIGEGCDANPEITNDNKGSLES